METLKKLLPIFILSSLLFLFAAQQELLQRTAQAAEESNFYDSNLEFDDEIPIGCDLIANTEYKDRNNFKIDLTIPDSKEWYTNIINSELNDGARIPESYKKQQYGYFTIANIQGNEECIVEAKVRISGDAIDHIDINNLAASIDVELISDNIFGFTDFKLFLPESRFSENEIFVTSLLSKVGFLAPTSFFVDMHVNGQSTKYIFQEKINKIFIESNNLKEGPIIEANEQIAWGESGWFSFNTILPPRILNKTWLEKSSFNVEFAKFALEKVHKLLIYTINTGYETYMCVDCVLNYESLSEENANYLKEYQLLLTVFRAHHGLSFSDRKYYVDPNTEFLYGIYYDGTPTLLKDNNNKLILNPNQLGVEQWEQKVPVINLSKNNLNNLIEKINNLNFDEFISELMDKGVETQKFNFSELDFKSYIIQDIQSYGTELNFEFENTLNNYFSNNQDKSETYYIFVQSNKNSQICEIQMKICFDFVPNNQEIIDILRGNFYFNERVVHYIGDLNSLGSNGKFTFHSLNIFSSKELNFPIYFTGYADLDYKNNTLVIDNPSTDFRLLIKDQSLIDLKIIFNSNFKNTQYSPTLLTGCVNILNSSLINFEYESNNASCEDSLNIVNSSGIINSINIQNSKFDGLDLDFSEIDIINLNIINSDNDCADFSYGNYKIYNSLLENCIDKAISIGEKSLLNGINLVTKNSNIGIAAKDSSYINIEYLKSENNNYCVASYRKKQEFDTPIINIQGLICQNQKIYYQDER